MAIAALVLATGAVALAVLRGRRSSFIPESREHALEKRVGELESTVGTLQRLLYEKQSQISALQQDYDEALRRLAILETQAAPPATATKQPPALLVVLGNDPALRIDLDALRALEREGKFSIRRPYPDSKAGIRSVLDRYRNRGYAIRYVHMAVHSAPEGIEISGDDLITPDWLSDNLKSVHILFINGCRSDALGDWLGVVPYVVAMRHEVVNTDAVQFARAFWAAIGDGLEVEAAFSQAVRRSPQGVGEFAELLQ
ncbi:MAG: hypothetical protein KDE23_03310 [Caldilinea sp.]|nr:hypothetical protein [Caldilinea sp.]